MFSTIPQFVLYYYLYNSAFTYIQQCNAHLAYSYRGPIVVLTFRLPLPRSLMSITTFSHLSHLLREHRNVFDARVDGVLPVNVTRLNESFKASDTLTN